MKNLELLCSILVQDLQSLGLFSLQVKQSQIKQICYDLEKFLEDTMKASHDINNK